MLEVDGKLSTESLKQLADNFRDAFSGSSIAAKALVLVQGVKWRQISVSPENAELLASRRFTTEELAPLYGCPPPIVGDLSHGTFTNSETAGSGMETQAPFERTARVVVLNTKALVDADVPVIHLDRDLDFQLTLRH